MQATAKRARVDGNTATNLLKLLALVFMICDHFGKMLLPGVSEMRMLGRLAFPLYAWCLVVGACYTRNIWRYALRLLAMAVLCQPLYVCALNNRWTHLNIFVTLLLGLLAIAAVRENWMGSAVWGPPLALCAACLLDVDYGWRGVLFIVLLYAARRDRGALAAVMIAFCLFWGATSSSVSSAFGLSLSTAGLPASIAAMAGSFLRLQGLAVLATPLMLVRMPDVAMPRYLGYALYPAHLAVLLAVMYLR